MDLTERIERRRTRRSKNELVVDRDALNPAVHLSEPVGRETLFEALLNAVDPLFDRAVPPNTYVWGPRGSGKSAIVTALVSALDAEVTGKEPFYTATRGGSDRPDVLFVYLDARRATSRFRLYRELLDSLLVESVPERGISTDALRERIADVTDTSETVLVAVDHLGEAGTPDLADLYATFEPFDDLAWIGVGRTSPEELSLPIPEQQVHVPGYTYELVDVLTVRGSRGLSQTLDHVHAQRLAEWADGDAHDALAALFVAAANAEADGATRLRDEDIDAGTAAVPLGGVPIGTVLALSENEQLVLEQLVERALHGEVRIETAAERIAARTDLTGGTVKRLLYELAQRGVLERHEVAVGSRMTGRRPSGVGLNFSERLFTALRD
ncbi:Cdc6/Cdc18 family protein [Halobellus limi]|jgi:Cdc6-like AAA superfamily ATPase|uniref:ATP-binding protein n=1 Tax=Halobellus limi TaxID=699433 RepID=A0A1H5SLU7_9EURY|nr:AAA family ATPase [Halobellus limi]QCC47555.1 ATP-binding protein [Halobellus limi]SEF51420.1 Cdc6-related protein, AAA superfamily ATPase [Halobellus limi]